MTRKVAKDVLKSLDYYLQNRFEDYGERNHDAMMMAIKALDQEPKTGHWQKISADKYSEHAAYYFRCSECGKDIIGEHNYCPNCGCRMLEGSE